MRSKHMVNMLCICSVVILIAADLFADFPKNIIFDYSNKDDSNLSVIFNDNSFSVENKRENIVLITWDAPDDNIAFSRLCKYGSLSPNKKYAAKFAFSMTQNKIIIVADLKNQTAKIIPFNSKDESSSLNIFRFEWISNSKVMLDMGPQYKEAIVADIDTQEVSHYDYIFLPVWDAKGENRAESFYNFNIRSYPDRFVSTRDKISMYIRYNGYWVYPKAIPGPMTRKDVSHSDEWRESHPENPFYFQSSGINNYNRPESNPSIFLGRDQTVSYVFSMPDFVADTKYCAFIETALDVKKPGSIQIQDTRLVLLDASEVNTNPPSAEEVHVKKVKIPLLVTPANDYQWLDYAKNIRVMWNNDERVLDIWKCILENPNYMALNPKDQWRKIGHIPIDPETLGIGEPVYVLTGDKFPWGQWAVEQKMGWEKAQEERKSEH